MSGSSQHGSRIQEHSAQRSWLLPVLVGAWVLFLVLVYTTNPLHAHSLDPRLRMLGFTVFWMPSRSMEPTIPENSLFSVSAWPYIRSEPRPGDIVVFRDPSHPSVFFAKRIIAAGGSTIEIVDGVVLVDGHPLSEEYVLKEMATSRYARVMPRVRVPPMSYFVMGDNRDNSMDSRVGMFVPRDQIIGEVGLILPPL